MEKTDSVHHLSAGEGLNLLPNFQKGGDLTGPQFLEGVAGKQRDGRQWEGGWGVGGGGGGSEILLEGNVFTRQWEPEEELF